jgi:hypothetical protein
MVNAPLVARILVRYGDGSAPLPTGYDWQYQTISVLLYPDQNPRGYLGLGPGWSCAVWRASPGPQH